jgi:tellurite resistance protein TerC
MTPDQITYTVFGVLLVLALVFDLGLLSKKNQTITAGSLPDLFLGGAGIGFFHFFME